MAFCTKRKTRGGEKIKVYFFSSLCISLRASLKMPRSPRLAHKAPVMQVRKETKLPAVIRFRKIDSPSL